MSEPSEKEQVMATDPTIKVPGYVTLAEQELEQFKETKGSVRYDVKEDPFGEADLTNVYIRRGAFKRLKGATFPGKVTLVALVRE